MKAEVHIIKEKCKRYGIYIETYQASILEMPEDFNPNGHHMPCIKNPQENLMANKIEKVYAADNSIRGNATVILALRDVRKVAKLIRDYVSRRGK